ncbi:MAG: UDP-N-acetylglucosamine--N-acetylmuramyl-(pentapeptide) pyrophosphoryl-undecaprenol N-acetylglucosamine transferase [Flavobacteriaceae bacterium]|nr:UDP-N-acetylglucosamine--N-acetylmuramyl-(pentapeptide) pyrophosphoryl-undecaprenol N-acetylglucosamine transferase [Flavobacteriaceae bacterium]
MKKIYIAAGGTGGHINAAISLGDKLEGNYDVVYISGDRYLDFQLLKDRKVIHISAKPLRTKNPLKLVINITSNLMVFLRLIIMILKDSPSFLIGTGGYVCGPTLFAGKLLGKVIFIVEQNAVLGLTNKALSKISNIVFLNFKNTRGVNRKTKVIAAGNPIRSSIQASVNTVSQEPNIFVFGGSLGAEQINKAVFDLVEEGFDYKVNIYHQVGRNKKNDSINIGKNIKYTQVEYVDNINEKYKWANIIISRAGASTISELRVIKRPSILIPLPMATDNHQELNALELKDENIFYVDVLDKKLKEIELGNKIRESITEIIQKKLYYQNDKPIVDAADEIINEIKQYVRNK